MAPSMEQKMHEHYMHRCLHLAALGSGYTAPNPMVGAVLVHDGKIIGEGYHQKYGESHAEVNCINDAKESLIKEGEDVQKVLEESIIYVSLEPCSHFGKTPPCADLIIANKIPEVVIGCRDPFVKVDGKGIEKLEKAGIKVTNGILEKECKELNKRFFHFHLHGSPFIILKWAQTADGKIAGNGQERLFISNSATNQLVHKWRSEEAAILVGTNTALLDDPELINRNWIGPSPIRMVIDKDLSLPPTLKLLSSEPKTIVFNEKKHGEEGSLMYYQISNDSSIINQVKTAMYQMGILSVMVEGGAKLLQAFIDEDAWDEARVITNTELNIGDGLLSPKLPKGIIEEPGQRILSDEICIYKRDDKSFNPK